MKTFWMAATILASLASPCAVATPVPYVATTPGTSTFMVSQSGLDGAGGTGGTGGGSNGYSGAGAAAC